MAGSGVPVATVAAGFPHGLSALASRIREVASAREAGAQEIDIVIRREWALTGNWKALFEEIRAFREAAGECHLKAILSTGELGALGRVGRAALTALMAGADFVKTSTGKEEVNAALPAGLAMARALAHYERVTGVRAGIKPAGGIKTSAEAYSWVLMAREALGENATAPDRFRIGASSLLGDVIENLRRLTLT
jgi:deoxyribose-phosphate aldolase